MSGTNTSNPVCMQYGCGLSAPEGWINYDASPTLRLQRLPVIGGLMPGVKFPAGVVYGDVRTRLPLGPNSVDCAYCSHVLEHLSLKDCRLALRETHRVLKPGGVFRMVLPDLERLAKEYVGAPGDADASNKFMRESLLGVEHRPHGMMGMLRHAFGNAEHLWMWDERSLGAELEQAGFTQVRRAAIGDSGIEAYAAVEEPTRWGGHLGMQCVKATA